MQLTEVQGPQCARQPVGVDVPPVANPHDAPVAVLLVGYTGADEGNNCVFVALDAAPRADVVYLEFGGSDVVLEYESGAVRVFKIFAKGIPKSCVLEGAIAMGLGAVSGRE